MRLVVSESDCDISVVRLVICSGMKREKKKKKRMRHERVMKKNNYLFRKYTFIIHRILHTIHRKNF